MCCYNPLNLTNIMNRKSLMLYLLILFAVSTNVNGQEPELSEYLVSEIAFKDSIANANPGISHEQLREIMRRFSDRNYPDRSVIVPVQSQQQQTANSAPDPSPFNVVPDSDEYRALEALYNQTGGSLWKKADNWLQGTTSADFTHWYGITVSNGDITGISLPSNNLRGPIPAEIALLVRLEHLSFYRNYISGSLPLELFQLNHLITLNLESNEIRGDIPVEIGGMANLVTLALARNELNGEIPAEIGNLTKLDRLDLSYNQLAGTLPSELANMTSLRQLVLHWNLITGKIPPQLGQLTNLVHLSLSDNRFYGEIPANLGLLNNLVTLSLNDNDFEGTIPSELGQLSGLINLTLAENRLTGPVPSSIGQLSQLEYLQLENNLLEGSIPTEIGNLPNLIFISLYSNRLSGRVPSEIGSLSNLEFLYLANNELSEFPDFSNADNNSYVTVNVSNNKLTFEDLEPNFKPSGYPYFLSMYYENQKEVPLYIDLKTFTLSVDVGGQNNQYEWYKNGAVVPGQNQSKLVIQPQDYTTENTFQCRVTNTIATKLTLYSETTPVEVEGGVYYTLKDGNWTEPGVWSFTPNGPPAGSWPKIGSRVYIQDHHISVSEPVSCRSIEVIVEKNSASLTVDGAVVTMYGELKLTKKQDGHPANVRVINGGKIDVSENQF